MNRKMVKIHAAERKRHGDGQSSTIVNSSLSISRLSIKNLQAMVRLYM